MNIISGNCDYCHRFPAVRLTFRAFVSIWLHFHNEHETRWYCRDCALAKSREFSTVTILGGWMGLGIVWMWLPVFLNYLEAQKAASLPAPHYQQASFWVHGNGLTIHQLPRKGTGRRLLPQPPLHKNWLTYTPLGVLALLVVTLWIVLKVVN